MIRIIILAFFLLNFCLAFSQNNNDEVYTITDQPPTFENGIQGFYWFVSDSLKYPEDALTNKIEGRVMVQFIVNQDGEVTDEKVVQGLSESTDAEALRVMQLCPNWNPGTKDGEPCNVRMVMPIAFKILTEEQKLNSKQVREKMERKLKKKELKSKKG